MEIFNELSDIIFDNKDKLSTGLFKDLYEKVMEIRQNYESLEDLEKESKVAFTELFKYIHKLKNKCKFKETNIENISELFTKNFETELNPKIKTYNVKKHKTDYISNHQFAIKHGYFPKQIFKIISIYQITDYEKFNNINEFIEYYKNMKIVVTYERDIGFYDIENLGKQTLEMYEFYVKKIEKKEQLFPIDVNVTEEGLQVCINSLAQYFACVDCGLTHIPVTIHYNEDAPELYNPRLPCTLLNEKQKRIKSIQDFRDSQTASNVLLPIGTIIYSDFYDKPTYGIIIGKICGFSNFTDYMTKKESKSYRYLCITSHTFNLFKDDSEDDDDIRFSKRYFSDCEFVIPPYVHQSIINILKKKVFTYLFNYQQEMLTISYHLFGEMFFNYESLINDDIETYVPLQKFVNQYGDKNIENFNCCCKE